MMGIGLFFGPSIGIGLVGTGSASLADARRTVWPGRHYDGFYRLADAKLLAAQKPTDGRYHECH